MCALHRIAVMAALLAAATPGMANDPTKLIGVWQVVSYEMEYQATGAKEYTRGKNPTGYLIFTPDERVTPVLTDEGRKAPATDQDRAPTR